MGYITLVKSRAACRLTEKGSFDKPEVEGTVGSLGLTFEPAGIPTQNPTAGGSLTADPSSLLTLPEAITMPEDPFRGAGFETVAPTVGEAVGFAGEYADSTVRPSYREIDSCCGHGIFTGIPYDSELRTCCDDGKPSNFNGDEGSDPCNSGIGIDYWN